VYICLFFAALLDLEKKKKMKEIIVIGEQRSLEEQAQLLRVFRLLAVDLPLKRMERKIKVSFFLFVVLYVLFFKLFVLHRNFMIVSKIGIIIINIQIHFL
jgi:hypothetical protein